MPKRPRHAVADAKEPRAESREPRAPSRRRLFLAVTILAPWLLLLILEGALRLGGYGGSYPLFIPQPQQDGWMRTNPDVAWRYFRGSAFRPTPEAEFFRAAKPANGFRIVFQGESSAQGFPYGHGAMPSRMLERWLQEALPDREVESINVALTAVSSWTLLDQADEVVALRPDAVLVYTGHNEWYGAFGAASSTGVGGARPVVKAYLLLRHSRLAQLLAAGVDALVPSSRQAGDGAPRTVMQLMAGEQRVPIGSDSWQRGLAQFRANLGELLARYRDANVPVLVGTLASNERDQRPLAASDGPDPDSALAHFERARALAARGDSAGAREAWRQAKERDALRFRAPEAINAIIREEAARHGATVVETQRALERASPGGVVGSSLMLEHLHPNLEGYRIIATAFHDALLAQSASTESPRPHAWRQAGQASPSGGGASAESRGPRAESTLTRLPTFPLPVTTVDSIIGFLRTDRLVSNWPFVARGRERVPVVDTLRPRTEPERLAAAVVRGQLPWPEATERLREAAVRARDWETALAGASALALEYSWSAEPFLEASHAAVQLQRWPDALHWARESVRRRESPGTVQLVGLLMLRLGDHEGAMPWLKRASDMAPTDRRMAIAYRAAGMLPLLERRAAGSPRDTTVLRELATAYAITQQSEKARATAEQLLRVAPGNDAAKELIARLDGSAP